MSENKPQRLQYLFHRYVSNELTEEEYWELWKVLHIESMKKNLSTELQWIWEEVKNRPPVIPIRQWDEKMKSLMEEEKKSSYPEKKEERLTFRIGFMGWAAVIIAILVSAIIFFQYKQHAFNSNTKLLMTSNKPKDILPGSNKAILTLSNGSTIILDSAFNGIISQQGGTVISKTGSGSINYQPSNNHLRERVYNTLSTPRGGQYQITLPDGTRVWLNSASSLYYPTSFTGDNREVRMTGEAYFEVAKDVSKPFVVSVNGMKVDVLGTHFNIMAYDDAKMIKTTLLSGSVSISESGIKKLLVPGEQAEVNKEGKIAIVENANTDAALAWKNNLFWFQDNTIQEVMRQLSRWYDADVIINGDIPEHFTGSVPRNVPVSRVFELLEETGHIRFAIKDNKIIVSP